MTVWAVFSLSMAPTTYCCGSATQDPPRQSVLAADFGLSPRSVTNVVDALERQGLAERQQNAADRRRAARRYHRGGRGLPGCGVRCPRAAAGADLRRLSSQEDRATLLRLLDILDDAARPLITAQAMPGGPPVVPA